MTAFNTTPLIIVTDKGYEIWGTLRTSITDFLKISAKQVGANLAGPIPLLRQAGLALLCQVTVI